MATTITANDKVINKATTFVSFDEGHLSNSGDVSESVRLISDRENRTFFRAGAPENNSSKQNTDHNKPRFESQIRNLQRNVETFCISAYILSIT